MWCCVCCDLCENITDNITYQWRQDTVGTGRRKWSNTKTHIYSFVPANFAHGYTSTTELEHIGDSPWRTNTNVNPQWFGSWIATVVLSRVEVYRFSQNIATVRRRLQGDTNVSNRSKHSYCQYELNPFASIRIEFVVVPCSLLQVVAVLIGSLQFALCFVLFRRITCWFAPD